MRTKMKKLQEDIAKMSVLNAKNLYRLLVFLRGVYPVGYSYQGLRKELNIKILTISNLESLELDGLIKKKRIIGF